MFKTKFIHISPMWLAIAKTFQLQEKIPVVEVSEVIDDHENYLVVIL